MSDKRANDPKDTELANSFELSDLAPLSGQAVNVVGGGTTSTASPTPTPTPAPTPAPTPSPTPSNPLLYYANNSGSIG